MKTLHIETRHRRGGAERNVLATLARERNVLATLARERARGHEAHLAVGGDSDTADVPEGVTVHTIPRLVRAVAPLSDLLAYRALRRLIRRERYDVVHTHQSKAGVIGRFAARGVAPTIAHTVHMPSFGPGYSRLVSPIFRELERLCARFTDLIVTVGDDLAAQYQAGGVGRTSQYRVVHSPIDVDRFTAVRAFSAEQLASARERFDVGSDDQVIVMIGSLEPRKRHEMAMLRLTALLGEGRYRLLIAGDGPARAQLDRTARESAVADRIRLLGHVEAVDELLAVAAVLVLTSVTEGVPQVVVQALAAGVPVVATDVPGLREIEGAPIAILPADGSALASAVREIVEEHADAVDVALFEPWTESAVAAASADVLSDLGL